MSAEIAALNAKIAQFQLIQKAPSWRYTAVLLEPRKHRAVPFVLRNLLENLDDTWGILFLHGASHGSWATGLLEEFSTDRISLHPLPVDNFPTPQAYSEFVASEAFLSLIPTEQFLIVRTTAMIHPAQKHKLAKFLQYDYVGAPWPWAHMPYGGNGGLSLRKKSAMRAALAAFGGLKGPYEDQFFSMALAALKAKLPDKEVAREFSVEQMYHPEPFGFHSVWEHMPMRYDDLLESCPGLQVLESLQK